MLGPTSCNVELAPAQTKLAPKDGGSLTGLQDELESNERIPLSFFDHEFVIQYCNILENFIRRRFGNEMKIGTFCESGEQPVANCAPTEAVRGWKQPKSRAKEKSTNSRGNSKVLESKRSVGKAEVSAQTVKLKPIKVSKKSTSIDKDLKTTKSRGNGKSCGKSIRSLNINGNNAQISECRYCATIHKLGSKFCPGYGNTCENCGNKNHTKVVCWYQKRK